VEIKTFVQLGREQDLGNGLVIRVDATDRPRRFFVRLSDLPQRPAPHIRQRKYRARHKPAWHLAGWRSRLRQLKSRLPNLADPTFPLWPGGKTNAQLKCSTLGKTPSEKGYHDNNARSCRRSPIGNDAGWNDEKWDYAGHALYHRLGST